MEYTKRKFRVLCPRLGASDGRYTWEISRRKKNVSLFVFSSGGLKELFDIREMGHSLINLEMNIVSYATYVIRVRSQRYDGHTSEWGIMFNSVVQIQLCQVESVLAVTLLQHVCCITGDEEAKGWWKVARGSNCSIELLEGDIFTVVGQDTWVQRKGGGVMFIDHLPWFAIAFNTGQEHLLSPSFGAIYSGHVPPAPGCPSGTTCPTFLFGVTKLSKVSEISQTRTAAVWDAFAMGEIRNIDGKNVGERIITHSCFIWSRPVRFARFASTSGMHKP